MNSQWISDLGTDNLTATDPTDTDWTPSAYQLEYPRTITAINDNAITIDAPMVQTIEVVQTIEDQYGGADIYRYTFSSRVTNIGFEGLRLESSYTSDSDESHGWIRQVTAQYFGYGLVTISGDSTYITVEDCAMVDPKSQTTGGRKYSFNINTSTYVLMRRCYIWGGRHDYVSGSKVPGLNVFVDCLAENTKSDVGPHHRYATGQLYDNIKAGSINVHNRLNSGSGHGWSGAQILFWNCDAGSMICDAPTGAMNWSIGNKTAQQQSWGKVEPDGIWESQNNYVTPRALYYRQLQERSGISAVREVGLPEQDGGTIWTGLSSWAGEGLYGDEVVAWAASNLIEPPSDSVSLTGRVRNLQMLENGVTTTWSKFPDPARSLSLTIHNSTQPRPSVPLALM